jgi:hypothetical protein
VAGGQPHLIELNFGFIDIGQPVWTAACDINTFGTVVGWHGFDPQVPHPAIWPGPQQHGKPVPGTPPDVAPTILPEIGQALGVSDEGYVVGWYLTKPPNSLVHPFVRTPGGHFHDLFGPYPSPLTGYARRISSNISAVAHPIVVGSGSWPGSQEQWIQWCLGQNYANVSSPSFYSIMNRVLLNLHASGGLVGIDRETGYAIGIVSLPQPWRRVDGSVTLLGSNTLPWSTWELDRPGISNIPLAVAMNATIAVVAGTYSAEWHNPPQLSLSLLPQLDLLPRQRRAFVAEPPSDSNPFQFYSNAADVNDLLGAHDQTIWTLVSATAINGSGNIAGNGTSKTFPGSNLRGWVLDPHH